MARRSGLQLVPAAITAGLCVAALSGAIPFLPALLKGLAVTFQVAIPSALLSYVLSVAAGLGRCSSQRVLRWISAIYVEVFRGVSLLVILFWLFFVLPEFGLTLTPFVAAVLGISLNAGAYGAEIVRGALQAVPRGQIDASIALNMPAWRRHLRVVLPQALVIALPAMTSMTIELVKGTALVSAVTLVDLTAAGVRQNQLTYQTLEIFGVLAVIYYGLSQIVRLVGARLETSFTRHLSAGIH